MVESAERAVVACPACGAKNRVPAAANGTPRCAKCQAPLPWVVDADDDTFAERAEAATVPVLVDLWAPWCGPCRMVSPVLERLAGRYAGRLKLVKVNVDTSSRLAARFQAQSIPTMVVLKGADVLGRQVGAAPEHVLGTWLTGILGSPPD